MNVDLVVVHLVMCGAALTSHSYQVSRVKSGGREQARLKKPVRNFLKQNKNETVQYRTCAECDYVTMGSIGNVMHRTE